MKKIFLGIIFLSTALTSCGGGGVPNVDIVQQEDAQLILDALSGAVNQMNGEILAAPAPLSFAKAGTFPTTHVDLDNVVACQVSGQIHYDGRTSIIRNTDTGITTLAGLLTFFLSNADAPAEDCEVGNGIVLNGTTRVDVSGIYPDLRVSINGTIETFRKGGDGVPVPLESCLIFLTFADDRIIGGVCGYNFD